MEIAIVNIADKRVPSKYACVRWFAGYAKGHVTQVFSYAAFSFFT